MSSIFSGGTYVNTTFTGTARSDIQSNLKTQLLVAGWTNVATGSGLGPGNVGTFTVTVATPAVVTMSGHGFLGGERVNLQTTGALPTNLSVNTLYFVKYIDANTFNLATTLAGTSINTTGTQSGTHTLNTESMVLESSTQSNVTNPIRVRLLDIRGTSIQVHIENQAGTVKSASQTATTAGGSLLPGAGKTYRIIATKYQFFCFTAPTTVAREYVFVGMLNVPSFVTSITDHGFMMSNCLSDANTSTQPSFRTSCSLVAAGAPNAQLLWNSAFYENANSGSGNDIGLMEALIQGLLSSNSGRIAHYRWANDVINAADVLISAGLSSTSTEGKIKGQLYDIIFIAEAFAGDSTDTFNGHTWFNITQNQTGVQGQSPRGGIWMATS